MGRVAVVALFHETNTFSAQPTSRDAFEAEGWHVGEALLARYRHSKTVIGGFLTGLTERGHDPVGVFGAFATPAGRVTSAALSNIRDAIHQLLPGAEPFDGVLVELHGAMVSEGDEDPEAGVLADIRQLVGERPVVAVYDLHANMTPRRVIATDLLVGYRTNPHIDTWETGRAAARHLADLLAGAPRPHVVFGTVPLIAPAIAQATSQWPLGGWLLRGQQLERRHDFVDVTMHGGYAYADVAHAGMAVTISTRGDVVVAEEAANELCQLAWSMRDQLQPQLPTAQQAIGAIPKDTGPVALADTGDNINGGSPGDHLDLIEAAASSGLSCLGTWVHRELLRDALSAAPDSQVELPGPLARAVGSTTGIVVAHAAGTFINKGPMATGKRMDIGRSAVIRIAGLDLLLQGRAAQPNDPEMFRSAGLEPANYDAVLLKGASALRAGWAGVASTFVAVSTPGESDTDLRRLAYRRLEGRVWPLTDRPSRSVNVLRIR